jgi:hypothetical protein
MSDGALAVTGDLAVTQEERDVAANPGEAYSGQVYGKPVTKTVHHEVTFVIPAASLRALETQNVGANVSAVAKVGHENFPQLLPAVLQANWPVVVEDEQCVMLNSVGEDYAGPVCTGTTIRGTYRLNPPSSVGEDYRGSEVAAADGTQITIQLSLAGTKPRLPQRSHGSRCREKEQAEVRPSASNNMLARLGTSIAT